MSEILLSGRKGDGAGEVKPQASWARSGPDGCT
jgi:hypothetical protein